MVCVKNFSGMFKNFCWLQELLNVRDELERERETLAGELGRAEEEKIACLREVEEVRQALVEADLRCGESETARQLLEGQVSLTLDIQLPTFSQKSANHYIVLPTYYHLKPSTVKAKNLLYILQTLRNPQAL